MKNLLKRFAVGSLLVTMAAMLGACSDKAEGNGKEDSGDGAANYPKQSIEVIVPAGAGGDTDLNTRVMARGLAEELGKPVVVTNVAGAGGTTGTKKVLDAKPDGYTVLAFHNSMLLNKIYGLADYTYTDYEIAGIGVVDQSNTIVTSKDSEFDDIPSLIEYAKKHPGDVTVATEVGSMTHIQMLEFEQSTGVKFNIVDVGGASDKLTALLGGRVDLVPTSLGFVQSYLESGDFVSLGIMADERLESAPDVKTFKEQGIDISIDKIFYYLFPKGTPEEIVNKFSKAMENVVADETYQEEIKKSWVEPVYLNPEETNKKFQDIESLYEEVHKKNEGQ